MDRKIRDIILTAIFRSLPREECIVFLYGSQATGENVDSSDIDVGLLCNTGIAAKDFLAIEEEIQNTLPTLRKVDLVDFDHVSGKVKTQALREMQLWHAGKNCRGLLKTLKPPRRS